MLNNPLPNDHGFKKIHFLNLPLNNIYSGLDHADLSSLDSMVSRGSRGILMIKTICILDTHVKMH